MKKIIIICGHGHFATGLKSSINLIAGNNEDVYYVDFTEDDSDITLKQKLNLILQKNKKSEVLFVCDILGGTPFKTSAEIANDNMHYQVVCGCNLISMIDAIFNKDEYDIEELAKSIVESTKKTAMVFKKVNVTEAIDDTICDEGI